MTEHVWAAAMEDPAGVLTFNVGTVNMDENGRILLQCNIRYPASVEYSDIRELLERQLKKYGFLYNEIDYLAPVYHKKDSSLIRCLMSAYQEVTGDMDTEPMAIRRSYLCKSTSKCCGIWTSVPI